MKAKEYAARYLQNPGDKALFQVWLDMFSEMSEITKARHATSDMAVVSILKELDQKWRVFVRIVNDPTIRPDGFMRLVIENIPEFRPYFPEVG